jgi:hypothetical protein
MKIPTRLGVEGDGNICSVPVRGKVKIACPKSGRLPWIRMQELRDGWERASHWAKKPSEFGGGAIVNLFIAQVWLGLDLPTKESVPTKMLPRSTSAQVRVIAPSACAEKLFVVILHILHCR